MLLLQVILLPLIPMALAKYNQRVFVDVPDAIGMSDALRNGFRVVLSDSFVSTHYVPQNLPTLYVTAIPLRNDEKRQTMILYPEALTDDKQITIVGTVFNYTIQMLLYAHLQACASAAGTTCASSGRASTGTTRRPAPCARCGRRSTGSARRPTRSSPTPR